MTWIRRTALAVALTAFAATGALADNYDDGVAAVQSKNYAAAVQLLQKAITEAPVETPSYLPHFWIGIARFNLGDIDGALRHWRISQDQGAVAKAGKRGELADWISRAQAEKQKRASSEPDASKKAADAAISKALQKQGEAISRGRDRSESYRAAARKLQEANAEFRKGGYAAAQKLAEEAQGMFGGTTFVVPIEDTPAPPKRIEPSEPVAVESAARADARVALQGYRRHVLEQKGDVRESERLRKELERAKSDGEVARVRTAIAEAEKRLAARTAVKTPQPTPVVEPTAPVKPDLERAYRAFATGDLAAADQLLTKIIDATPTAEAFLLRGCTRYTKAVLTKGDDKSAVSDFKEALRRDRSLRLDESSFSPKLVVAFERVRGSR